MSHRLITRKIFRYAGLALATLAAGWISIMQFREHAPHTQPSTTVRIDEPQWQQFSKDGRLSLTITGKQALYYPSKKTIILVAPALFATTASGDWSAKAHYAEFRDLKHTVYLWGSVHAQQKKSGQLTTTLDTTQIDYHPIEKQLTSSHAVSIWRPTGTQTLNGITVDLNRQTVTSKHQTHIRIAPRSHSSP